MIKTILALILCLASLHAYSTELPQKITLATTDWCPYACKDASSHPGISYDYITQVLTSMRIEVSIEFYPWSRAIELARTGEVDGLLTAVKSEAPSLIFTTVPTDHYQMCFFTLNDEMWRYDGKESLKDIRLGIIKDYGYGEPVDTYISESPKNVYAISDGGISKLYRMLKSNRFDAFIDDSKVVRWELKGQYKELRQSGCLKRNPFYIAINPNKPWAQRFLKLLGGKLTTTRDRLRAIQDAYY